MKISEIEINEMEPENISEIILIEKKSGLSNWSEQDYLKEIENPDSFFKIIKFHNKIAGFIMARLITHSNERKFRSAEIYNIAIEEKSRNNGLGRYLLNSLIWTCKVKNLSEIWLEVRRSNSAALRFYSRHGFGQVAERKNYYTNPIEDAVIMKCILSRETDKNEKLKT